MIECIFTIDYEIYGNGSGSLGELACEPTETLRRMFAAAGLRFVVFPDAAELEMIESERADPDAGSVKQQLRSLHVDGFEIGLHLHPWWYSATRANGGWVLDYGSYNMCALPPDRIASMVDRGIGYLRDALGANDFTPFSFRAGHLIFQPSNHATRVLAARGVRVDSSLFKGGVWRLHGVDYRAARANGYFWRFTEDVATPDSAGVLLELPIFAHAVPIWQMVTPKRIGLERKASGSATRSGRKLLARLKDVRLTRPLKLDYCSMTRDEMHRMLERVIRDDERDPATYRPVVAIGHTKDLVDVESVERLLEFLHRHNIGIVQLRDAYRRCTTEALSKEVA